MSPKQHPVVDATLKAPAVVAPPGSGAVPAVGPAGPALASQATPSAPGTPTPATAAPPAAARGPRRFGLGRRLATGMLGAVGLLLLGPLSVLAFGGLGLAGDWRGGSRESAGIAPLPSAAPEAIVQAYAARTVGWRGAFGVHTWLATKRAGADHYVVHHVIGWRVWRGGSGVVTQQGPPDFRWFGAEPIQLIDHRGAEAETMIDAIEAAVARYPYASTYHAWPGPNSNTFIAGIARDVPALRLDLPANALGKDYLGGWRLIAPMPSGTGWQVSLFGVLGIGIGRTEGIEVNLLGLSAGFDFDDLALRLPGYGSLPLRRD